MLEIVRDNLYCTLGTLDVCYQAELELTLADFHELEDIPDTAVSLTEVARCLALVNIVIVKNQQPPMFKSLETFY